MLRYILLVPMLLPAQALAVIVVTSTLTRDGAGIRAQALITDPTGVGGGTITAVAIKEIRSSIFVVDSLPSKVSEGFSTVTLSKRQLSAQKAYGLGLPFGYSTPPTTDPTGPWFGLVWPYRDQYDYFPGPFDPLGDDVGTPVTITPTVVGFLDVDGIARGGPTDPTPAGGDVNLLLRGLTGNGLTGPATYFEFDITPNFGDPERFVTVQILSTVARVVVQDAQGAYSEIQVTVEPFETQIQLPEPAAAALLLCAAPLLTRRRR
jgi:hypothetical protein